MYLQHKLELWLRRRWRVLEPDLIAARRWRLRLGLKELLDRLDQMLARRKRAPLVGSVRHLGLWMGGDRL